ncbi:MAG: aminotransferase class I/II-fold pyridoxal phosphate-dependent enzyme [Nitrosomonas sp.]|nr:aminotransferase class I/II-fold pyridoxal phosphate-dependent enzyme [Nitrosomonas sp.]
MSLEKLNSYCTMKLSELTEKGTQKGSEKVIAKILMPKWLKEGRLPNSSEDKNFGARYLLMGDEKAYLLMNSNSYLGLTLHPKVAETEEEGVRNYGTGPGAVRFISGTYQPHIELENRLAKYHKREAAMIFSAAYAAVMGVLPLLINENTLVVSDQLNHNCIINAIRLSRPAHKEVYRHLDMAELKRIISKYASTKNTLKESKINRVMVVTDGIFSMRGDHAPLNEIVDICREFENFFEDGIITVADDSHGVGAFGETGRGTEEFTKSSVDILIATLGKALGVNGGYVTTAGPVIEYLRETSPFYVYSNPITSSEALAATRSLDILESEEGIERLKKIRSLTFRFKNGLIEQGFETIPGEHPVTPIVLRDTHKTALLINYLVQHGILATGLNYPVVPKGDEEIRFQINANQTIKDIDYILEVLKNFSTKFNFRS